MNKFCWLSAVGLLALTVPEIAAAQAAADSATDDAIVVTARRRAEDAATVPISITAFSERSLERKSVSSLGDITKLTPGLGFLPGGTKANPFITIRGQSKGITGNINPGVIPYLNDVPLPNYGSSIPTYDISNVQVLKGPQGTLFGRNAIGGAILVNTNAPTHSFAGSAMGEVSSYNSQKFEGMVNVPLVKDVIALRLAGQFSHEGGTWVQTTLVAPYSVDASGVLHPGAIIPAKHGNEEFRTISYRGSLLIEPSDAIKNVTVVEYTSVRGSPLNKLFGLYPNGYKGESGGPSGNPGLYYQSPAALQSLVNAGRITANYRQSILNLAQCGTSPTCDWQLAQAAYGQPYTYNTAVTVDPWTSRVIMWGVTNTTTVRLGDHATIKNIFGYRNTDSFTATDNDGTPLDIVSPNQAIRLRQYTNELQLAGELFDNKLKYTIGGFYYDEAPAGPGGNSGLEVNSLFGISHSLSMTYLHNKSKAVYGQVDYSLDPLIHGLTLTAGVRQTWDSVKGCSGSLLYPATAQQNYNDRAHSPSLPSEAQCLTGTITSMGSTGVSQILPEKKFNKLTYTLGANWQITPGAMVYVAHRRGYRAGSYNTPLFNQEFLGQVQAFRPETLTDWEVGTKIRWNSGDMRGSFDLAMFQGKDKDLQLPVQTSALTNVCVPEALTGAPSAPLCTTTANVQGRTISHAAATTILNAGELTIRGFEASGTFSPVPGLTVGGGISYVDYNVDKITLDPNLLALMKAGSQAVPSTIILQQQPTWTYNADVEVVLPGKILGGELSANANWKHSTKFVSTAGQLVNPAWSVVDARVSLSNVGETRVSVSAWVKNLTNEYYSYGISSGSPQSLGEQTRMYAAPRTFGLSVKYAFGG